MDIDFQASPDSIETLSDRSYKEDEPTDQK
jgi:hypothetical protein